MTTMIQPSATKKNSRKITRTKLVLLLWILSLVTAHSVVFVLGERSSIMAAPLTNLFGKSLSKNKVVVRHYSTPITPSLSFIPLFAHFPPSFSREGFDDYVVSKQNTPPPPLSYRIPHVLLPNLFSRTIDSSIHRYHVANRSTKEITISSGSSIRCNSSRSLSSNGGAATAIDDHNKKLLGDIHNEEEGDPSLDEEDTSLDLFVEDDSIREKEEEKNLSDYTKLSQGKKFIDEKIEFDNSKDEEDKKSPFTAEEQLDVTTLPKGSPEGFYVVKQYKVPKNGFDNYPKCFTDIVAEEELDRLGIVDGTNVTLPVALMILEPDEYPSLSKARKACRKGYIIIHRGPLGFDEKAGERTIFYPEKCIRGRVGDRVFASDVIGKQVRMGGGFYPSMNYAKPQFDLPVVYEDDHFAIALYSNFLCNILHPVDTKVNKPAGVVVYSHRKGGHGRMTVRAALPYVLKPPKKGTVAIMRRPNAVHRLDKPTSGLLLVAKTKPAMIDLTRQFVERRIKKTYTAIINGLPDEPTDTRISSSKAKELGVDVETSSAGGGDMWQLIENPLDGKSAITVWRALNYTKSLKATEGTLTLVEMKPKTGRYHQLRRHMAWVRERPIVGDSEYDGGGEAMYLRGRGLFLCSNKVSLDHPYFNTEIGRKEWDAMENDEKYADGVIKLSEDGKTIQVHARIDLPKKFTTFLQWEEERVAKFSEKSDE